MKRISYLASVFMVAALGPFDLASAAECGEVLVEGTKSLRLYHENTEYRRLLETRLSQMTFDEAKRDTSITGSIPIGDVLLGAGFTQASFEQHRSYFQKQSSLFISSSHTEDVLLSTGDKEILTAWSQCMQNRSGLALRFKEAHGKSVVLVITWFPAAGVPQVNIAQDYVLPAGVVITSGKDVMQGKRSIIAGTNQEIALELPDPQTPLSLTLSAVYKRTPRGSDSAFLPSRMKWIRETRNYQFNVPGGVCSTNPTLIWDTPGHTGTISPPVTYCSSSTDGWRFSQWPQDVSVETTVWPSEVPLHQIAVKHTSWTGADQFNVSLGCSSSTGTDIRCTATTRLVEERLIWTPRTD